MKNNRIYAILLYINTLAMNSSGVVDLNNLNPRYIATRPPT